MLLAFEECSQVLCLLVQQVAFRFLGIMPREAKTETIAVEARQNVQMRVEDILPGSAAVCHEKIETIAAQVRGADGAPEALRQLHDGGGNRGTHVTQGFGMYNGNDEQMTRGYRIQIHEGGDVGIPVEETGG